MARFVLVHGAFSGAWIWGPLTDQLKAAGHTVDAFDLPGLGDDNTPAGEVTLEGCAARLCEVLASSSEPAIVAAHSMGGVIATQGSARCPERVAALVYVSAFIPRDGQSLLDLTKLPEGADDQVQANLTIAGDPPVAPLRDPVNAAARWVAARKPGSVVRLPTRPGRRFRPTRPLALPFAADAQHVISLEAAVSRLN